MRFVFILISLTIIEVTCINFFHEESVGKFVRDHSTVFFVC